MLDHRVKWELQRPPEGESTRIEREKRSFTSLHEQAQHYLLHKKEDLLRQKENPELGKEYGESIVRSKMLRCAKDPKGCTEDYLNRRKEADRPLSEKKARLVQERIRALAENRVYAAHEKATKKLRKQLKRLHIRAELEERDPLTDQKMIELQGKLHEAEGLLKGRLSDPIQETTSDSLLVEEVTQEAALRDLDQKIEQGLIDPASLNAQMWLELELPEQEDIPDVRSINDIMEYVQDELSVFIEKGFLSPSEAKTIVAYGKRYAETFAKGFEKKHGKATLQELFELTRDNARKVAYQTKMDKRTLAGSDHGVRHIYEGNTHFAEQMMDALRGMKGVDFKSRDEILIRQIIIDHDMGYTTYAAMTEHGSGAAKDHPCIGCRYVEANAGYYRKKFGKNGYDVVRDVLLNHSYPSSRYHKERPDGTFTYNRDLIRSVVSSSDSLSTTHETKAMGLFRFPEAIDILQNLRLYADSHDGQIRPETLAQFRQDFYQLIDDLVNKHKISESRSREYRQAVERKLSVEITKKTFGQFSGVIRNVGLEAPEKEGKELRLVVYMETSRLQSLVADAFGDPVSIAGFKKAMEAFGMNEEELKRLGKVVNDLRKNPRAKHRRSLQQQLVFITDRARFVISEEEGTGIPDEREEERQAALERFENFHQETARDAVKSIFENILALSPPRSKARLFNLSPESLEQTFQDILQLEDTVQHARLKKICHSIHKHLDDKKPDALEALLAETQRFLSKKERVRLADKLAT